MIDRTITLPRAHYDRLAAGQHTWWDDNTGREVLLLPDGTDPGDVYEGAQVVTLSVAHIREISEPGGLLTFNFAAGDNILIEKEVAR